MNLALTGATGFVGGATLARAIADGHAVRALTRRPRPERGGVTWIAGALDDAAALGALVDGADAVVHVAGVVNAPDRAGFAAGNVDGTAAMLAAASRAGVARFVHVSSLAAREPGLSDYGWSKAEAEALVMASDRDWTIVRPPAVYGPGDTELRDVFRLARVGVALLPSTGRMSAIHVDDLARLLVALAVRPGSGETFEVADASGAMTQTAFARAIGEAVGRRVLPLAVPRGVLSLGARLDGIVRGRDAKLTRDRVAYLAHPDWTADPALAPPRAVWAPGIGLAAGLAETALWYRERGLI